MAKTDIKKLKETLGDLSASIIATKFIDRLPKQKQYMKPEYLVDPVKVEIEKIYKGKDDKKMNKLVAVFNNAKTGFSQNKCEDVLNKIKQEINKDKKHWVGIQAAIVSWCDNLIKQIKKCSNAKNEDLEKFVEKAILASKTFIQNKMGDKIECVVDYDERAISGKN